MKSAITHIARLLVGGLFVFSGVIKLNDPMGFSYKLEEYFSPSVLNLPFLEPFVLPLSFFLLVLEVLVGITLLLGMFRQGSLFVLAGLMIFFTFLTFYSAYFNKVTDCGCFGDAIPLTPWESFTKDVILSVLIGLLFWGRQRIQPLFPPRINGLLLGMSFLGCVGFGTYVLNHLPVWDFRAFKPGTHIETALKSAEELGLQGPVYETFYTLKNSANEKSIEVSGTAYVEEKWFEKPEWVMQIEATRSEKIKEGYVPPIHDFSLIVEGEDRTASLLQEEKLVWITAYRLDRSDKENFQRIADAAWAWEKQGFKVIALTATDEAAVNEWAHEINAPFSWCIMDGTTVKTINRGNPGITLLKKGKVIKHLHGNDVDEQTDLMIYFQ